jgi:hypothetical protein
MDNAIQIDVIKRVEGFEHLLQCNMYADGITIKIFLHMNSYEELIQSGFFIRDGKSLDSANVLNTTKVYKKEVGND